MTFSIGDKVTYCRRSGYKVTAIVKNNDSDLLEIRTNDYQTISVHVGNSPKISRDWVG